MSDIVAIRSRIRKKQKEYFEWFGVTYHEQALHEYDMMRLTDINQLLKLEQEYNDMCQLGAMMKLSS